MYYAELAVLLLSCYITAGFNLHGHGLKHILEKRNLTGISDSPSIQTQWIQQPLDHFNNTGKMWNMKYFQRLDMWQPNGPVYLFINGEDAANFSKVFLKNGIMYELAMETNGAMFISEHRYYGDSNPFEEYTSENLKFLSSRQALADNAKLLKQIKLDSRFRYSKIVVVGGSYAGNLAAWMKLLYPDLVDAAISSSAPVLAKTDFSEYIDTVSDDFNKYGTVGCFDAINKMFQRYKDLLKTDKGIEQLKEETGICGFIDMRKPRNQQTFFHRVVGEFLLVAQYGGVESFKYTCERFTSSQIFSSKDGMMSLWSENLQCFDCGFDSLINDIKGSQDMSWMYQTCTEFGYFVTRNPKIQAFSINLPVEYYYDMCTAVFGPEFDQKRVDEGVLKSNQMYGGLSPDVTKVVFLNGALDPWHRLSILKDISIDAPAILTPLSTHCQVLLPDTDTDPQELKHARKHIKYLIKTWIGVN